MVGSKYPISLAVASGLVASTAAAAASCSIAIWVAAVASFALTDTQAGKVDCRGVSFELFGVGLEIGPARAISSDLVIGSDRGLTGAELELGVFINSSDLDDLEDLAIGLELAMASATAASCLAVFWRAVVTFFAVFRFFLASRIP